MTPEQHRKADKLREKINGIKSEIELWEKELIRPRDLAYCQSWNNHHPADLKSNISPELFNGFRVAAMNELKLKLTVLKEEFEAL